MEPLRKALEEMERDEIIARVTEPIDWCSRLMIATKSDGDLRICLDPQSLNKSLRGQRYRMPAIEDTLPDIQNANIFSKFDLKSAFWQIPVDE